MKISFTVIVTILISLCLLPGLVLANPDDMAGSFSIVTSSDMIASLLPDSFEETFFTPLFFPFDLLSQHDRDALMDHATPDLWQVPVPNPEYWNATVPEEKEEIEKSDEYIFQGSITVGPWSPGLDSDILAAFNV